MFLGGYFDGIRSDEADDEGQFKDFVIFDLLRAADGTTITGTGIDARGDFTLKGFSYKTHFKLEKTYTSDDATALVYLKVCSNLSAESKSLSKFLVALRGTSLDDKGYIGMECWSREDQIEASQRGVLGKWFKQNANVIFRQNVAKAMKRYDPSSFGVYNSSEIDDISNAAAAKANQNQDAKEEGEISPSFQQGKKLWL